MKSPRRDMPVVSTYTPNVNTVTQLSRTPRILNSFARVGYLPSALVQSRMKSRLFLIVRFLGVPFGFIGFVLFFFGGGRIGLDRRTHQLVLTTQGILLLQGKLGRVGNSLRFDPRLLVRMFYLLGYCSHLTAEAQQVEPSN